MRRLLPFALLVSTALALSGCGNRSRSVVTEEDADLYGSSRVDLSTVVEVVLVGTIGETHAESDGYSLEVLREAVERADADVLLINATPQQWEQAQRVLGAIEGPVNAESVPDRAIGRQPELWGVAWALRDEIEVVAYGVESIDVLADRASYFASHPNGPETQSYLRAAARFQMAIIANRGEEDPLWLHSTEYLELSAEQSRWLSYHAEEDMGLGGELRVNARAAANIEDILDGRLGERVVILTPAERLYFLSGVLDARNDVRPLPAAIVFRDLRTDVAER